MTRTCMRYLRKSHRTDPSMDLRPNRRAHRPLVESLEDRTLLSSATLNISNSGSTKGLLSYNPSGAVASMLTIKTSTVITDPVDQFSELVYTISDSSESITLGSGAIAGGWTGTGTNSVTGPGSIKTTTTTTYVSGVGLNMLAGNDSVTIGSVGAAVNLSFNNHAGDVDTVLIGGPGGAQNISGNITITNAQGSTALTVDDAGDTKPQTVFVSNGVIANLEPSLINYAQARLASLSIEGAGALGTLNVNANDQGPVSVTGGQAVGSGTISIGSSAPIIYSSFLAVNITNAADQPLTQVTQTIITSTDDVPTAGKAFTYVTTTFADGDLQSKTSSFVASINWGDGTTPVAGSITADGAGIFQVSGSHTYLQTGSYPVVTTITDTGGTDSFSISGIPVTIADLGGSGLTTGSVAQVNLVSSSASIPAPVIDSKLVNPWGMATDANGDVWAASEGSGNAVYLGPGGPSVQGTAVVIPPASGQGLGSPAGIVSNSSTAFSIHGQPSVFLYSTLDGTISGWNGQFPAAGSPSAVIAVNHSASGAEYTGLALNTLNGASLLYAANFHSGQIEVYNSQFELVNEFTDPNLPAGYAPYNIENLGGNLYVTFAEQAQGEKSPVAQLGAGFVDVFSPAGVLLQQLIKRATLDAPWGLALAPASAGQYAGDLLVANSGDGQVIALNPITGQSLGAFEDDTGQPIVNAGLNGLLTAPGGTLYFTAGPGGRAGGLWGSLAPTPISVTIAPATLAATFGPIAAVADREWQGVVATFTDANIYALASDFTATVQWGDGSSDTSGNGSVNIIHVDGIGSSFIVQGSHTYTTATTGDQPEVGTITITDNASGNSVFAQGTVTVATTPTVHVTVSSFSAIVGEPYTGPVATFTDDAPDTNVGDYSATIDWGDGSTTSGAIALANSAGTSFIVTDGGTNGVLHAYAAATTGQDPDVVTVVVTKHASDTYGTPVTETGLAEANVAVSLPTLHATFSSFAPVAGTAYDSQVATFTEDDPVPVLENNPAGDPNDFYTATIWWGDGHSSPGTIVVTNSAATAFLVIGKHSYTTPTVGVSPYVVTVSVTKIGTDEYTTAIGNVSVADSLLFPYTQNVLLSATEGAAFSGAVAQFTDTNPFVGLAAFNGPFASQTVINWGDGKSSVGTIVAAPTIAGVFDVVGTHVYAAPTQPGIPDTVSVSITDAWGAKTTVTNAMAVSAVPFLTFTTFALPLPGQPAVVAGMPFTGDVVDFASPSPDATAAEFTAAISWGDGTPIDVGTVKEDGTGTFHVSGTHTYVAAGVFTLIITILEPDGTTFVDPPEMHTTITVMPPPAAPAVEDVQAIPLGNGLFLTAGVSFTDEVATFTTTSTTATASNFSATVDWGNDQQSAGTIIEGANDEDGNPTFFVVGTHVYDESGTYPFTVYVSTPGTASLSDSSTAAVGAAPLVAQSAPIAGTQGTPLPDNTVVATFVVTSPLVNPSTFATETDATVDWGDGSPDDLDVPAVYEGSTAAGYAFAIQDSHLYENITDVFQAYQVQVTIITPGGSAAVVTDLAQMTVPVLTDQPLALRAVAGTAFTTPVAMIHLADNQTTAADFSATVKWGDGTSSSAAIEPDGSGTIAVLGSHTYEKSGSFPIAIALSDNQGNTITDNQMATVSTPLIVQAVPVAAHLREIYRGPVARFTDTAGGAGSDFTIAINWGDGTTSDGRAVADGSSSSGPTFVVTGSHKYTVKGTYTVKITVVDDGGNQASASTSVSVGKSSLAAPPTVRAVARAAKRISSNQPSTSRRGPGAEPTAAPAHPHGPLR